MAVYNIPPEFPFVDSFAHFLVARYQEDLSRLGDVTVLTTTRRAARALQHAFLRETEGKPLILPRMRPLGDVDEDELALEGGLSGDQVSALDIPPAIDGLRRQLLLSRLIEQRDPENFDLARAAGLAIELAKLLDQVQTEGQDLKNLEKLVPEDYAEHWQSILEFLKIISEVWPAILEEEGVIDPARRRDLLLRLQIKEWQDNPPQGQIYAIGSTGSIPVTAQLLALVAKLPNGVVVLPGLDRHLDEESWGVLDQDPSHPQYGLARLIERMGLMRADIPDIPGLADSSCSIERTKLLSQSLRPAATTVNWEQAEVPAPSSIDQIRLVNCATAQAEAQVIALSMREVLEDPNKTAALVTPDRDLSRRVVSELKRWGIEVDDSAGASLEQSPPGVFMRLVARMISRRFDPISVLAVLKHPYFVMGYPLSTIRRLVRQFELKVLRGPRPAEGLQGLEDVVKTKAANEDVDAELSDWFSAFTELVAPIEALAENPKVSFDEFLRAFIHYCERLAMPEEEDETRLWYGNFGESAANFFSELLRSADIAGEVSPSNWSDLMDSLMVGQMVRSRYGQHPRLQIWGPIEARLQRADVMILGGLNKGIWPPEQTGDPWMSRPMRQDFNLPSPEKKIGLSAHDFQQAFCAKEVIITRAEKIDGAPTVPSRWLLRLQTFLGKFGQSLISEKSEDLLNWQLLLDKPEAYRPVSAPRPTPPVKSRPRRLSVTRIEKWIKDPYSIFADAILGLKPLDDIGEAPGGAERGTFIHEALEKFVDEHPKELPSNALEELLAIGEEVFSDVLSYPAVWAFWWPRFERMAEWFITFEAEHRQSFKPLKLEAKGSLEFPAPMGSFTLSGTADRIDRNGIGELSILDYKTGSVPSAKQVESGISPQLPLEAIMAEKGAFKDLPAAEVLELMYVKLSGGNPAGDAKLAYKDKTLEEIATATFEGLQRLVAQFDREATPYLVRPRPDFVDNFNDYEHLSRLKEWSGGNGND